MRMRACFGILLCLLVAVGALAEGRSEDPYQSWLKQAEACKSKGDMAGMEAALKQALQYGQGDEYVWRSLSWAQSNQGKGSESLATARENIRRNGECQFSLEQLCEAAIARGDIAHAKQTYKRALLLPRDEGAMTALAGVFANVSSRVYEITFTIDPAKKQKDPDGKSIVLAVPATGLPYQTATWIVENAESFETTSIGGNPAVRVKPKGNGKLLLKAAVTTAPYSYTASLAGARNAAVSEDAKRYLGKGPRDLDPTKPLAQSIAAQCKSGDAVDSIRRLLAWFKSNMKWDVSTGGDPTEDVLKRGYGNCGDLARAFVAVCRAAGVPSRPVRGFHTNGNTGKSGQLAGHSWVEVHVGGAGWVPLEPGDPASFGRTDPMKFRLFDYGFDGEGPLFNTGNAEMDETHFELLKAEI